MEMIVPQPRITKVGFATKGLCIQPHHHPTHKNSMSATYQLFRPGNSSKPTGNVIHLPKTY